MADNYPKLSIAVFISGGGSNLQAIIDARKSGLIRGEIRVVISNNSRAYGLERARLEKIPDYHISLKKYPDPADFLENLKTVLSRHKINLIVLAGYMKMLPREIIAAYKDRIINIHPALLPKFGGQGMYGLNVHQAVIDAGEKYSGATVHFVDNAYDHGAILIQRRIEVRTDDTPDSLAARVLDVEHQILPQAVAMFA